MKKSKKVVKEYKFKEGFFKWKYGNKAQAVGEEIDKIKYENNGILKPRFVIEAAKNSNNPLHEMFEWNDEKAAELQRLQFARGIISSLVIEVKFNNHKTQQNVFYSVTLNPENKNDNKVGYLEIGEVMGDDRYKLQVVNKALQEISYWQGKYSSYNELSKIFESIELTKEYIAKKKQEMLELEF